MRRRLAAFADLFDPKSAVGICNDLNRVGRLQHGGDRGAQRRRQHGEATGGIGGEAGGRAHAAAAPKADGEGWLDAASASRQVLRPVASLAMMAEKRLRKRSAPRALSAGRSLSAISGAMLMAKRAVCAVSSKCVSWPFSRT